MQTQSPPKSQMQKDALSRVGATIKEHMEVIGADGVHVGTVDRLEGGRIKLTRADSVETSHAGHHHYIDLGLVAGVADGKVRLSANADVAYGLEDDEDEASGGAAS